MARRIVIDFRCDPGTRLCGALLRVLGAVDAKRILPADFAAARRRGLQLVALYATRLRLSGRDAEMLLAECDAVYHAIDRDRALDAELAAAVEAFREFRHAVYCACSVAEQALLSAAA